MKLFFQDVILWNYWSVLFCYPFSRCRNGWVVISRNLGQDICLQEKNMVVPRRQMMFDRVQFVNISFRTAFCTLFCCFNFWHVPASHGIKPCVADIFWVCPYKVYGGLFGTPQPHTVTDSLCQSDSVCRPCVSPCTVCHCWCVRPLDLVRIVGAVGAFQHLDLTQTIPTPRLRWRGEGNTSSQPLRRQGVGGLCICFVFFHAKGGRFGVESTNQQSFAESRIQDVSVSHDFSEHWLMKCERKRQTDKTRQDKTRSAKTRQASQPDSRGRKEHTHRNTHTHTRIAGLRNAFLPFWGVVVAEWTRHKSSSFCNLLSGGCGVLQSCDLQGDDETTGL